MDRILLVEDDQAIVRNLRAFLEGEGFAVIDASGQRQAIAQLEEQTFDLCLVDITLTDGNGFGVLAAAKSLGDQPVIFLTASGDEYNVVMGLDLGAQDYIAKPFRSRELLSRMRSVLRRRGGTREILKLGELQVDPIRGTAHRGETELYLSALEYRLLLLFLSVPGQVLTRDRLLEELWDAAGEYVGDNTLSVYIKRLRDKVEPDPAHPRYILTVRGMGYRAGE